MELTNEEKILVASFMERFELFLDQMEEEFPEYSKEETARSIIEGLEEEGD